jgi:hypothetical protein
MGYPSDDRHGGDRWRDRDQGREDGWGRDRDNREYGRQSGGWNEGRREEMGWGPGDRSHGGAGGDRGFFGRAGEQVRSWFGGDDDERGRGRMNEGRSMQRDNGYRRGGMDEDRGGSDYGRGGSYGWMSGGWGNQAGESWNRDRPGVESEREGWFTDSVGGERGRRYGGSGGEIGRGPGAFGSQSPSRSPEAMREARGGGGHPHDPLYSEWRRRQLEELDRDYEDYCREHQSQFEQQFGSWRSKRQSQRQMLGTIRERMSVLGSDGSPVGTVDKVSGDRILLAKSGDEAGGMHRSIPCSWVDNVDEQVRLNRTAEEAQAEWRSEEQNRALFERPDQGSEGPHVLNRSFSGTYDERDS